MMTSVCQSYDTFTTFKCSNGTTRGYHSISLLEVSFSSPARFDIRGVYFSWFDFGYSSNQCGEERVPQGYDESRPTCVSQ